VLDVDLPDGPDSLAGLEARYGALPETVRVLTGGGGLQIYFRYPGDKSIANSTSKIAKNIDVRGEGGYVIAPPSLHVSGQRYQWI
jgi:Bifunctional DNA primase/polymerase, N-terminal